MSPSPSAPLDLAAAPGESPPPQGSLGSLARSWVASPDLVVPEGGRSKPLPLAMACAAGLVGAGLFFGVAFSGVDAELASGLPLHLVVAPPLAAMLTFPPLFLLTGLRGRAPRMLDLLGVSVAGPTVAGAALGASVPLLLLYRLTGDLTWAFAVLVAGLMVLAVGAGLRAAVANQRRAGPSSPGMAVIVGHYFLTLWTALVVAIHLS